jgi:hypothetical protein
MSFSGGNRPPFRSGVARDRIRNITGHVPDLIDSGGNTPSGFNVFNWDNPHASIFVQQPGNGRLDLTFRASNVVPTGSDNAPSTVSILYWRKTNH